MSHTNSNLLCPVQSSVDVIVTEITTMVFGNVATVVALCKMLHWAQITTEITTMVFGNVATVVALCKMLHWAQMDDGSNVFQMQKTLFFT